MAETPEFETVRLLAGDLKLALQGDLTSVCLLLQGTDPTLLTPDNVSEVTNTAARSEPERAVRLVTLIQTRIKSNPKCYHALVGVLQKSPTYYSEILKKLNETFLEQKAKSIGQAQSPPHEGFSQANSTKNETARKEIHEQIILTNQDFPVLLRLLQPVAAHWQLIAPHLNPQLQDGTVAQIQMDNSGKPDACRHCLREMIGKWLKRTRPCRPSWQNLRTAIEGAGVDGGDGVIDKIDEHIQKACQ